eukprot:TRINITY_DN2945_c1_g1_i4.p1 TRINITY_DN2945_c1_g1~~TRINITY_DN2945_c1_g1_i4.p1  ORF type:complete len:259 (-),score=10.48 TRINITY_DN2945_c1_g1_i4:51-746(-)
MEPRGLDMSLDQMIKQKQQQQKQQHIPQNQKPAFNNNGFRPRPRNRYNQGFNEQHNHYQQHRHQGGQPFQHRDHQRWPMNQQIQQPHPHPPPFPPFPQMFSSFGLPPPPQQQPLYNPQPDYREHQTCFQEEETGDVVVRYRRTEIVRVRQNGEVVLTSGGYHGPTTLQSINDALNLLGIRVTPQGDVRKGVWNISDGNVFNSRINSFDSKLTIHSFPRQSTHRCVIRSLNP